MSAKIWICLKFGTLIARREGYHSFCIFDFVQMFCNLRVEKHHSLIFDKHSDGSGHEIDMKENWKENSCFYDPPHL